MRSALQHRRCRGSSAMDFGRAITARAMATRSAAAHSVVLALLGASRPIQHLAHLPSTCSCSMPGIRRGARITNAENADHANPWNPRDPPAILGKLLARRKSVANNDIAAGRPLAIKQLRSDVLPRRRGLYEISGLRSAKSIAHQSAPCRSAIQPGRTRRSCPPNAAPFSPSPMWHGAARLAKARALLFIHVSAFGRLPPQ